MDATLLIVPTHLVYMNIPATELRMFVDGLLPALAKNSIADSAAGYGHRYVAGHDLFLDIPRTFLTHGPMESLKHAGHALLTDFPTKAGIPIPGFSHTGLGPILQQAGIHKGWLSLNLCDAGCGFVAVAEGSADLAQALNGTLTMDWGTFFDTFAEGGIEIGIGLTTQNLPMTIGGIENVLAGFVATWNRLSVHVDPLDFFGAAGTSALIGFVLAYGLAKEDLSEAGLDAMRSGTIGALYTLSPSFGYGVLAGFSAYRLGGSLAKTHNESMQASFSLNEEAYRLLVEEVCKGKISIRAMLESAMPYPMLLDNASTLPARGFSLYGEPSTLSEGCLTLSTGAAILKNNPVATKERTMTLPVDPPVLFDWYRTALYGFAA
jgi:hypothetical protein